MRKVFVTMLVAAPLLAACGMAEEPLVPELKGRWDTLSKIKSERPVRVSSQAEPVASDPCRTAYMTFSRRKITMHVQGTSIPVFHVADVKRDGQRLTITGGAVSGKNSSVSAHGKIVLLLRNGEVRFDDIFDETGRSVKYERLPDGHPLRSKGATSLGEALGLVLDVKPCKA